MALYAVSFRRSAAITDAVHHATGVRVRELPVKIEHLLTSTVLA
jgi:xanthine dehydrogenase YagR molybdenum-binding subunit